MKLGETLAVTSRGERVAVLAPIGGGSRFDRLVAEGRITSAQELWTDPEPVALSGRRPGSPLTEVLLEDREEQDR